jgi:D-alanyl-D-alanine dipeptidase
MRGLILKAVTSPQFAVRLDAAGATPQLQRIAPDLQSQLRDFYATGLPGRQVTVAAAPAAKTSPSRD